MNNYSAYPHPIPGGQYWAMVRLCRDARPSPIMDKGEKPKKFETRGEAAEECLRYMVAFMNGTPIRGEIFDSPSGGHRQAAEAFFKEREGA